MSLLGEFGATVRGLRRRGPFVVVAATTLAISIGASTAMFSLIDRFLLSSLPYEAAERLVMIWRVAVPSDQPQPPARLPLPPGVFTDLHTSATSFERIAALVSEQVTVTSEGEPRRVHLLSVTGDFFPLLRIRTVRGRPLGPEDVRPDADRVVVISHRYWQQQLGGDPEVLGRKLRLGRREYAVVGVLPDDFRFTESLAASDPRLSPPVDLWATLRLGEQEHERGFHSLVTMARLQPGTSVAVAQAEASAYAEQAAVQYPASDQGFDLQVVSLRDQIFTPLRPVLLALWAATSFVLLIACTNLAILLMARGQAVQQDVAVRLALGASRGRIVARSLLESVVVALLGGALALPVAYAANRLLLVLAPVNVLHSYAPALGGRIVAFTLVVSLIAGLLSGLLPAVRASRIDAAAGLREGRAKLTRRSRLALSLLVVSQIALTTTLLIGMGLSARSFVRLSHADLGFAVEKVVTFELFLPFSRYRDTGRKVAFLQALLQEVRAVPGVTSAGMNYGLPLTGVNPSNGFRIDGRTPLEAGERQSANLGLVNAEYFETLGIPLLQGRLLQATDTADMPLVAIIDQRMVQQYFRGEEPLGQTIRIASDDPLTVVGVVGTVQQDVFEETARPYIYLPYQQRCYMFTTLAIKTDLDDPLALMPSLRSVLRSLDPEVPLANGTTLERTYSRAIAPQRFSLLLVSVFAAIALFLTQIGTYGVMRCLAELRQREAGIRMALGATPRQVFTLIAKQGFVVSLIGTVSGLGLALYAERALASLVYEIGTRDALVFSVVPMLTFVTAFLAYYRPARSLSTLSPSETLRSR